MNKLQKTHFQKILAECTHMRQGSLSKLCCNTCSLKEKKCLP